MTSLNILIVAVNMEGAVLLIIIAKCVVCSGIECYVCETEKSDLLCRNPKAPSVSTEAVYCSADGRNNVCSVTAYKRKCRDGGTVFGSYTVSYRAINSEDMLKAL